MNNTVVDTLLTLSPPIRLVNWLEQVFEQKRAAGEEVPETFTKWLERCQRIRSDLPSEIDDLTADDWQQIGQVVQRAEVQP